MRRQPTRTFRPRRHTFLALVAGALLVLGAQAPSFASEVGRTVAPESGRAPSASGQAGGRQPAPSMDEAYASREAASKPLEKFKGGDVVIIGSTGLVIVLLVVLIIVIL